MILNKSNITINRYDSLEGAMFNPFKKSTEVAPKDRQKKAKLEERRQRAQARGQKPIK